MGVKQVAMTNGFRLGLDWSNPPENIDVQALTQARQCEFDRTDNALRTVPGVRILYDFGLPELFEYCYLHLGTPNHEG